MKLSSFLKDKILFLVLQAFLIAFICVLLVIFKVNSGVITMISLMFAVLVASSVSFEFIRKRLYYKHLYRTLNQMEKKQYISSVLEAGNFAEAEILSDILRQTTKAMNDEISFYKRESEEYREYIETWIHEVKMPISSISLICENNKNEVTGSILEETTKIDSFVEQALYYARSTNVERDYTIHDIHLETLVKEIVKKHAKQLIATQCSIEFNNLDLTVYSDKKWLHFILGQIISNSIKYRSHSFNLSFSASEFPNSVVLYVQDNGIGIPESDLFNVFNKSFTGVNGRRFGKSTGIGLYLCKRLCEKMNLKIDIQSVVGQGTTLQITFPKDKSVLFE